MGQPAQTAAPAAPAAPTRPRRGISPGAAAALGVAAGVVGGVVAAQGFRRLDDVRQRREEVREGDYTIYREPGRTIVRDDDRIYVQRDENERFRALGGRDLRSERRGDEVITVFDRPDGSEVVTITDENGRLLRRIRRTRDGREVIIIDNTYGGRRSQSFDEYVVEAPPPPLRMPRERYIVEAERADSGEIYEALTAPPVAPIQRRYTLDQVRYSPDLRAHMRSVDVDTINFDSGSWTIAPDQVSRLSVIGQAVKRAIEANPAEVFMVEGYTDAVGADVDNVSLSDRRAQSVAEVLTRDFGVPPENLTTQGYGEQYPKVPTQVASRENRRVTLRRITPLLNGDQTAAPQ